MTTIIQRSRAANFALSIAERTPLRRLVTSLVLDPESGLFVGSGDMERDWDERARRNARFFVAGYDWESEERFRRSGERDLETVILNGLELPNDARTLEIGCGLGRLLRPLSRRVGEAHGVDISSEMVRRAREHLGDCSNAHVHHSTGKLRRFPEGYFDFCYSYNVFQHIPEKQAVVDCFRDAAFAVRLGGLFRFQICRARPGSPRTNRGGTWLGVRFTEADLRELLPKYGFANVDIVEEASPADKQRWDSLIVTCQRKTL